jgi:hypothetical protein
MRGSFSVIHLAKDGPLGRMLISRKVACGRATAIRAFCPYSFAEDIMIIRCLSSGARFIAALIASIVALTSVGLAQTAPASSATSATISGTVRGASGAAVNGATVEISGPVSTTTTSNGTGDFTATVPPGLYTITVRATGFNSATYADFTATAGTSSPLSVSLSPVDLSSLRTIGSTTSTSRSGGSAINTGSAASQFVSGAQFAAQAAPQVNDVLQRLPDVTLQHMGGRANIFRPTSSVAPKRNPARATRRRSPTSPSAVRSTS